MATCVCFNIRCDYRLQIDEIDDISMDDMDDFIEKHLETCPGPVVKLYGNKSVTIWDRSHVIRHEVRHSFISGKDFPREGRLK